VPLYELPLEHRSLSYGLSYGVSRAEHRERAARWARTHRTHRSLLASLDRSGTPVPARASGGET
jgi:hypothetical protein